MHLKVVMIDKRLLSNSIWFEKKKKI